jgi:hypothetical protein
MLGTPAAAPAAENDFVTPLFGMDGTDSGILVADAGQGVVLVTPQGQRLLTALPGVADVAAINQRSAWAVTSEPFEEGLGGSQALYVVSRSGARQVADLLAFEQAHNPDGAQVESNPFGVANLDPHTALVADAAANDVLIVRKGRVRLVATLPAEVVSTANAKALAGCPDAPPDFAFVCELPDEMPAEPVPTSVQVGPDGAYYVSELKGFPAPVGESRIWRIEPGTTGAACGSDSWCSVVVDGLTSVVDINFAEDGTLYAVEIDADIWLAAELGIGSGGTVQACDVTTGSCTTVADSLPLPSATAVAGGVLHVRILSLVPGAAAVIPLA